MNKNKSQPASTSISTDEKNELIDHGVSPSSSIVARAGQVMALIIALGVLGMISSMLVSESLSGDAAQINRAGALRMQALRISRAFILSQPQKDLEFIKSLQRDNRDSGVKGRKNIDYEIDNFDERIKHLFEGGVTSIRNVEPIELQYQSILTRWDLLKELTVSSRLPVDSIQLFDLFVSEVDQLVTLLQKESEKKLAILRLIQGVSLLALMIIAFVVLYRLNRSVVVPLKQIVTVAEKAGKGDFSIKTSYVSDNELGVLARTINQMSEELELTHQDYQDRVDQKTKALTRSNQSLQVLYKAASNLASNEYQYTDTHFLDELDQALGMGKVHIKRYQTTNTPGDSIETEQLLSDITDSALKIFPIAKPELTYGILIWHLPKDRQIRSWHINMLQAMSDIIATTIDLQEKRNTEKRVLIFEERAVIARELHDSLAQSLSYLKVQMSLLTRKISKSVSKNEIDETIIDIKEGLNSAYQQLRELLTTFRLKLDDPTLSNALQGTIIEFGEKCQYSITLNNQLPENLLSPNQEIHVLQIIREALSNVQRHAQASEAGVELTTIGSRCLVEIWDNGVGFNSAKKQGGHFGIGIMQERAKSLGSKIDVQQRKPSGTNIRLELDL